MAYDGKIVLGTEVDTSGIKNGTNNIKSALEKLKEKFKSLGESQAEALTVNNKETLARIDEIKKKLAELSDTESELLEKQQALSESYIPDVNDKDLFEDYDPTKAMTAEDLKIYNDLGNKIDAVIDKIWNLKLELEELGETSEESADDIEESFGEKLERTIESVGKSFSDFGKKIAQTAKRLLVYHTIYKVMRALIDLLKNILMSDKEFKQDWEELKAALITAAQPLINIIVPALKAIVSIVRDWAVSIGRIAAALSGMTYKQYVEQAKATKQAADNFDDMEESAKSINKSLAGFDDIQILSSGNSDEASNDYSGFESLIAGEDANSASAVQTMLTAVLSVAGGLIAAIGLILLSKGQVAWGLGFVIAGAAFWAISEIWGEYDPSSVISLLNSILETAAALVAAIGLILLTKGQFTWGLAFIIAGAAFWAISEIATGTFSEDAVLNTLIKIMAIAGTALAAIGLILLAFGQIPWGIAALAVGVVMLVSAVALSSDKIVSMIQGPLGIIMGIVGAALLVLGIILICTGVGIPLGLALIAAGAVSLVTVIAANKNGILQTIKSVWQSIKNFWNKYIAQIFTAKFWGDLGKKGLNGLISVFENAINGIIGIWESLINFVVKGLNKISFDVPDWVPLIGGKTFGFNIPEVSFKRVSIPRLAQGAVIPANSEFLAVLGDQKHGTNIEAPASLIKQMVIEALNERGGESGNTTVILELDGRELGRAVVSEGARESRRMGTKLVVM